MIFFSEEDVYLRSYMNSSFMLNVLFEKTLFAWCKLASILSVCFQQGHFFPSFVVLHSFYPSKWGHRFLLFLYCFHVYLYHWIIYIQPYSLPENFVWYTEKALVHALK